MQLKELSQLVKIKKNTWKTEKVVLNTTSNIYNTLLETYTNQ